MPAITVGQTTKYFEPGTCYGEIVQAFETEDGLPALLVLEDGRLRELWRTPEEDHEIKLLTARSAIGMDTYKRSLNFLFLKAVYDVTGKDRNVHAILQFSNRNGYYYLISQLPDGQAADEGFALQIRDRMRELARQELPLKKSTVSLQKARDFFRKADMQDKEKNFRYRLTSTVNFYTIEDFSDYFYGYMVWHTGFLKTFDVTVYQDGLMLLLPDRKDPLTVGNYQTSPKLFAIQQEAEKWGAQIGIGLVGDLNDAVCNGLFEEKMLAAEAQQEARVAAIAQDIIHRDGVKFVMIAGPSSSGKTTFSRRLAIQLTAQGRIPHPISLDNFYLNRADCPRDEDGNYDFECLESLDLDLIQRTFTDLQEGKETELPYFDFKTGTRKYRGDMLKLGDSDILIIEGIHGLNPRISEGLPDDACYLIYISALTQLNMDEHNLISTTDGRLIRRMIRDYRTRATSARETIQMWPSVRKGEESYIFPYQENADAMFNSALIYELSVLKTYAEPLLFQIPEDAPEHPEAHRLLKFLGHVLAAPSEKIPLNSILREFTGGGIFDL